ncbi:hypothetical protein PMKS-000242 [Pichia membranifaciens]|uniref:Glutaredoxin domain-containing protein n=1 Tax=Pichia membranifaciens TaxID=4926 RepID=A0A1Q2YB55_9ASCO|nr:hypothetical protein PMKS-000242 [Pichia membranifaciens]
MGIPLTSRKRKLLTVAIPEYESRNPLLNDDITVQIPGESTRKTAKGTPKISNSNGSGSGKGHANANANGAASADDSAKLDTKKLTNANVYVKSKEGGIDESKVKEADSSDNIPLVAGDPASQKAHEKAHEKAHDSSSRQKDVVPVDDGLAPAPTSTSTNGIKADKELGSLEQKETLKKLTDDVTSNPLKNKPYPLDSDSDLNSKKTNKVSSEIKDFSKKILEAQEKLQEKGPSKNVGSSFNPKQEFEKILSTSPVVIFSKSYCPFSKKLKHLLKTEYHITPEPLVIELDDHENGKELQQHVGETTGRFTVPNFIVAGKSRGGADDILALHDNDELIDLFHEWSTGSAKIKKLGAEK